METQIGIREDLRNLLLDNTTRKEPVATPARRHCPVVNHPSRLLELQRGVAVFAHKRHHVLLDYGLSERAKSPTIGTLEGNINSPGSRTIVGPHVLTFDPVLCIAAAGYDDDIPMRTKATLFREAGLECGIQRIAVEKIFLC